MIGKIKRQLFGNNKFGLALIAVLLIVIAPCGTRNTVQSILDLPVTEQLNPARSSRVITEKSSQQCNAALTAKIDDFTFQSSNEVEVERAKDLANTSKIQHFAGFVPSAFYRLQATAVSQGYQNRALYILFKRPKILPVSYKSTMNFSG
ncbi:MAG: hypothetical protein ACQERC_13035 [Bacteroidota bacterium]